MVTFDFRMRIAYSTAISYFRNGSRNLSAVWFLPADTRSAICERLHRIAKPRPCPDRGMVFDRCRAPCEDVQRVHRYRDRGFLPVSVQTIAVRRLYLAKQTYAIQWPPSPFRA